MQATAWFLFAAGLYRIGHKGDAFAYDNEGLRHQVYLNAFALASRLVTNQEYASFIEDGGYERPELWLSLGWNAVQERGWNTPLYRKNATRASARFE